MEQRWAFLRPWVRPLRGRLAVRTVKYDADMLKIVEVRRLHKKEELVLAQYRKIRWGLLLLSLLARVDFAAWRHVVAMDCEFDPFNERDASLPRRLQIEKFCVSLMVEDELSDEFGWSKDVLLGLFSGLDELPPPGLIVAARRIARQSGVDLSTYEVPFIVLFEGGSEGCLGHVEALQAICDEYGGWHFPVHMLAHQSEFGALEAAFTVDSVQYITETQVVSLDDQDALTKLVSNSDNLVVSDVILNFEPREIFYESLHFELQSIGGIIELLFRGSGVPTEKLAVVKRVDIVHYIRDYPMLARICTALAESRTIKAIQFIFPENHDHMDEWTWKQLAYALFSRHARQYSSVLDVMITSGYIDQANALAIADVLAADNPVNFLYGSEGNHFDLENNIQPRRAILKQGATATIQQMHPLEEIPPHTTEDLEVLKDISGVFVLGNGDDGNIMRALIPGYGLCLVSPEYLVFESNNGENVKNLVNCGVQHLNIQFIRLTDAAAGFPRLLELMGSTLTRLDVTLHQEVVVNVAHVFKWCPNLLCLRICGPQINTRQFIQCYRSYDMKIEELECDFDDLGYLAKKLSLKSRLSRRLKSFEFHEYEEWPEWFDYYKQCMRQMRDMLDCNTTLERLTLTVPTQIYAMFKEDMMRRDNKAISVAREPFPVACRIAFLSVFNKAPIHQNTSSKRPRTKVPEHGVKTLPTDMLVSIFQFAAESKRRRIEWSKLQLPS